VAKISQFQFQTFISAHLHLQLQLQMKCIIRNFIKLRQERKPGVFKQLPLFFQREKPGFKKNRDCKKVYKLHCGVLLHWGKKPPIAACGFKTLLIA